MQSAAGALWLTDHTEVLGLAGFDWLVLDTERANDVTTLIPQLMALKGSSSAQVVVSTNEPSSSSAMLDIGFYNFLVPFVETAEQAARRWLRPVIRRKGCAVSVPTAAMCLAPCDSRPSNKNIPFV